MSGVTLCVKQSYVLLRNAVTQPLHPEQAIHFICTAVVQYQPLLKKQYSQEATQNVDIDL